MVTLRSEGLSVDLSGGRVLHDVDLTFDSGVLTGIIGPNGAGKSTLLRALLGLRRPTEGSVWLDGEAIAAMPPSRIARRLAYLPQGQALHWPITVDRLVALGRIPHLGPLSRIGPADRDAIDRALALTESLELRERVATELSGGERARVLLSRALAVEAPGLLADEPLAALDPAHQFQVMDLLAGLAAEGRMVLAVLHDLAMAARYCGRIVLLADGRVVADGPPAIVLTPDRIAQVYGVRALVTEVDARPVVLPTGRL